MKRSNLTAPRSMAEAVWFASDDPIERPAHSAVSSYAVAVWLALGAVAVVIAMLFQGAPT